MVCTKCKSDAILNTVLNKEFWYCRTCKDEVKPEEPPTIMDPVFSSYADNQYDDVQDLFDHFFFPKDPNDPV
jgi:DNA replicative helicase MCM subunit Mcm2 (Cdc46/Mcm family)